MPVTVDILCSLEDNQLTDLSILFQKQKQRKNPQGKLVKSSYPAHRNIRRKKEKKKKKSFLATGFK